MSLAATWENGYAQASADLASSSNYAMTRRRLYGEPELERQGRLGQLAASPQAFHEGYAARLNAERYRQSDGMATDEAIAATASRIRTILSGDSL